MLTLVDKLFVDHKRNTRSMGYVYLLSNLDTWGLQFFPWLRRSYQRMGVFLVGISHSSMVWHHIPYFLATWSTHCRFSLALGLMTSLNFFCSLSHSLRLQSFNVIRTSVLSTVLYYIRVTSYKFVHRELVRRTNRVCGLSVMAVQFWNIMPS